MPRSKKENQPVPEELSEKDAEGIVGGQTLSRGGTPTVGFQEPLVGTDPPPLGKLSKVKKLTDEQDYPIEHGI